MIPTTSLDLFAGVPVSQFAPAKEWYERLLGFPPAFFPHDTEAVWELATHRYFYIVELTKHAGHARHTIFVANLIEVVEQIASRGTEPAKQEHFPGNVTKVTYQDADGNELGFAGTVPH